MKRSVAPAKRQEIAKNQEWNHRPQPTQEKHLGLVTQELVVPESKLILQPSASHKGKVRVFLEHPSGQRDDHGYFTKAHIAILIERFCWGEK